MLVFRCLVCRGNGVCSLLLNSTENKLRRVQADFSNWRIHVKSKMFISFFTTYVFVGIKF